MAKALFDPHHSQLAQSLIYLFEKRLKIKLYRPEGSHWYAREFYWHPLRDEALANLTKGPDIEPELAVQAPSDYMWQKSDAGLSYFDQDNLKFRWLPLEQANEIDYVVCTSDRNEERFFKLRNTLCPQAKIIRYIGNREENCDPAHWDIGLFATKRYYEQFKDTKPCVLFHPEFDTGLYSHTDPPLFFYGVWVPIVRNFLNFSYHHREAGSPWETWERYVGYGNEIGALSLLHGLGTPPPGIETELDVIIDLAFERMGRPELKDRSTWPNLRYSRGEPSSHKQIAELMQYSNMAVHIKRGSEGYGFIIHCLAACGRPAIIEQMAYEQLSAYAFLQHKETCLFVSGHDPTDKENYRWALQPENNAKMSETLYRRFKENVNFEAEAEAIRQLL